jgi:hypothetical protein
VKSYPVIARIDPGTRQRDMGIDKVTLFLPYDSVNHGSIACWARLGQHGEASLGYYRSTRQPQTDLELDACAAALKQYRWEMTGIPEADRVELFERKRLPNDWRKHAWE